MALIPANELAVLKSASEVKTVAETAPLEAEKMAVAKNINNAANTGAKRISWSNTLSADMKSTLEGQGYTVTQEEKAADPEKWWIISWE